MKACRRDIACEFLEFWGHWSSGDMLFDFHPPSGEIGNMSPDPEAELDCVLCPRN